MTFKVAVRGIYATAVTKLLLEAGFRIVKPSKPIRERLGVEWCDEDEDAAVSSRPNGHRLTVFGIEGAVEEVVRTLVEAIPDVLPRPRGFHGCSGVGVDPYMTYELELTRNSKIFLDGVRASVTPTVPRHHMLKIVNPELVDEAERPGVDLKAEGERLLGELVYGRVRVGSRMCVEHVKPSGFTVRLWGTVREFDRGSCTITLERRFVGGGFYDGLGVRKERGDWGVTLVREGCWTLVHVYHSASGRLKGEFYNVNTPIEVYPRTCRYADLEVDVVRLPDGRVRVIDFEKLEKAVWKGFVTEPLMEKALTVAEKLRRALVRGAEPLEALEEARPPECSSRPVGQHPRVASQPYE